MTPYSDDLKSLIAEKSARVDARLRGLLGAETPIQNLHDAMHYALGLDANEPSTRGKRLRPVLCLLTCEALGGAEARAMPFACAIELVHNFALIHDDIEDGDATRRGRPSVWARYGLPHAINIGDYMFTKVFALMTNETASVDDTLRRRWLRLISETLDHTIVGQALDMNARARRDFSLDDYLSIVREKTGYYLAAPILGGAMAAGADGQTLDALREFGRHVGPMFQITDDLIDLTEGKGRGDIGSDIREGKRSYLVAVALARATESERDRLFAILDAPRDETTAEMVREAIALFEKHHALDEARQYVDQLYAAAMQALAAAPKPLSEMLQAVFESVTRRTR